MADQLLFGSYIPTTTNLEITEIQQLKIQPDLKEALIRLYLEINRMSLALNTKDSALYPHQEFVTGGQIPFVDSFNQNGQGRGIFRFTYEADGLAMGATSIPLPFTVGATWRFLKIQGAATNETSGDHYPLPYVDAAGAANIELRLTNTTIEINNNSGVAFLGLEVVVEYVKQLDD